MYGSLTTKEIKKHSSRLVGWVEMANQGGKNMGQDGSWWNKIFDIRMQIIWEEQLGSETDHTTQGSSTGE